MLTRKVDGETPTLLLDESDAVFAHRSEYAEALRSILNTGYRRSGISSLCVAQGAGLSYRDFSTFCPKALAGIGALPDTVTDRPVDPDRAQAPSAARASGPISAPGRAKGRRAPAGAAARVEADGGRRPATRSTHAPV